MASVHDGLAPRYPLALRLSRSPDGVEVVAWPHAAMHDRLRPHYHTPTGATVYVDGNAPPDAHVHTHEAPTVPGAQAPEPASAPKPRARQAHDPFALVVAARRRDEKIRIYQALAVAVPIPVWLALPPVERLPIPPAVAAEPPPVPRDPLAPCSRGPPPTSAL